MVEDISKRKQAEEALREQDIRLAKLTSQLPGTLYQCLLKPDGSLSIPFTTDSIRRDIGFTSDDIKNDLSPLLKIIHPDDFDQFMLSIKESAEHLTLWQCEFRIQRPGEQVHHLWGSSIPEQLEDGSILWNGYITDISETKKTNEELLERQARLASIFKGAPVGIGEVENRVFIEINESFASMLGYSVDELIGQSARKLYYSDEDYNQVGKELYPTALAQGTANAEVKWRRKDGNPINAILCLTPITSKSGHPGFTFTAMDITERKRDEDALQKSLSLLEATLESTADGIIAFDLQNNVSIYNQRFLDLWQIPDVLAISNDGNKLLSFILDQLKNPALFRSHIQKMSLHPEISDYETIEFLNGRIFERYSQPQLIGDEIVGRVWSFRDITERKRIEESLRRERDLVAKIMDTSPVGIIMAKPNGEITYANTQAEQILGLNRSQILSRLYSDPDWQVTTTDGNTLPLDNYPISMVLRTGKAVNNIRHAIHWPNGRRVILSVNAAPLFDETRHISGIIATVTDITESLQAEEALRASEQLMRSILDEAPFGAHLYELEPDNSLVFIGANSAADRILGVDHSQFIGRTIEDAFPGLATTEVPDRYRRAASMGERYQADQVNYDSTGILGAFEVHAFGTEPSRMAVFFRDITERKRAEEQLKQSEERFRTIFQTTPDAITIARLSDGIYITVNDGFTTLTGYSSEEVIGKSVFEINIWENPSDRKHLANVLREQGKVNNIEERFRLKDGSILTALVSARIVLFDNLEHLLIVARDINDIKESQEALRLKTEELDRFFSINLDMLCIADTGGIFHRVSREWEKALGYDISELEGHKFLDFVHPDDLEATLTTVSQLSQGGDILNFVNRFRCKDSSYRWIEWRSTTPDGKLIYASARDITERLQSEETLRLRESYLTAIIENQPGLTWLKDAQSKFLAVNHQFSNSCGLDKPESTFGKTDFDVWPRELAEKYREDDLRVIEGRKPVSIEEQIAEHGELRWFATYKAPVIDESDTVIGTVGFALDVTERKAMEEALREREARLNSIFLAAPVGIGMVIDRTIIEVNETICDMTGYSHQELIGQGTLMLFLSEEEYLAIGDELVKQIRDKGIGTVEAKWRTKNNAVIDILLSSAPIIPSDFNAGVTFTALDITARKQSEEALRKRKDELERFERLTVGRELKMRELKSRLKELESNPQGESDND